MRVDRDLVVRTIMGTDVVRTKPLFDRIRSIGYQPFIQIGIQSKTETDFVICHTQQELAKFAHELGVLPQLGSSLFLMGLHAAMSLEFYDAGERFFNWCLKGDEGVALFSQYVASGLHRIQDHAVGISALHDLPSSSHFEFASSHR